MDRVIWKVGRVIDAHSHFRGKEPVPHYYEILDLAGHDRVCLLGGTAKDSETLARKRERPDRFYCFGQVVHHPDQVSRGDGGYLVKQVEALMAMGYDGLKMMEGKPQFRKLSATPAPGYVPLALDHRYFEPLWTALEERQTPITLHLADPIDWWTAPGALYRDGYEPQEEYFRQAIACLERHPRLRINFAHFMYMAPHLDRLVEWFGRFPNMRVDMAMGDEFLYYLSDDPDRAREFYIRWQDRILYGTDISDHNSLRHGRAKAEILRLFLETDETFVNIVQEAMGRPPSKGSNGRLELRGLHLPQAVLEKVLALNFEAFAGAGRFAGP